MRPVMDAGRVIVAANIVMAKQSLEDGKVKTIEARPKTEMRLYLIR